MLQNDVLLLVHRIPESWQLQFSSWSLPDAAANRILPEGMGLPHGSHQCHGRKESGYLHRHGMHGLLLQTDDPMLFPGLYSYNM